MKRVDYEQLVSSLVTCSMGLSVGKAKDYADDDILANFKRISKIAKLYDITFKNSYEYALFMVIMKLDRLHNLLKQGKTPTNESLSDTIQDAFNYLMLCNACIVEGE
jgi:hypothetical protein